MINYFYRQLLTLLPLVAILLLGLQSFANAQFYKKTGVLEASGIPYVSISMLSEDKRASMSFICDEGSSYPRITFKRKNKIQIEGDAFTLRYMNDQGLQDDHNFLTLPGGNIGRFFIRHTQLYAARFGKQPTMFTPGTATFSPDYINWDSHIRRTVLHDIVDGDIVDVTIWDQFGITHDYRFKTTNFSNVLPIIGSCLSDE